MPHRPAQLPWPSTLASAHPRQVKSAQPPLHGRHPSVAPQGVSPNPGRRHSASSLNAGPIPPVAQPGHHNSDGCGGQRQPQPVTTSGNPINDGLHITSRHQPAVSAPPSHRPNECRAARHGNSIRPTPVPGTTLQQAATQPDLPQSLQAIEGCATPHAPLHRAATSSGQTQDGQAVSPATPIPAPAAPPLPPWPLHRPLYPQMVTLPLRTNPSPPHIRP